MEDPVASAFDTLASGVYLEGLAIDSARDVIWYSDVIGGGVHGVKPDGSAVGSFDEERMWTGGVMMNADGAVLSTGEGGIRWNHPETGRSGWLLDRIDGKPINGINEMAPDGAGGIFFGTSDIEMVIQGQPTRPTALYRLTAEREVIPLAESIGFTNGIAHDVDRRRFYCNDTFHGAWAFDVTNDLKLGNRRELIVKEDADGMAIDADGGVWITGFRSGFLLRVDSAGRELGRLPTPAGAITQLRFGGRDLRDVYFNAVPGDGGDTLKDGGEVTGRNSILFRTRSPVAGLAIAPARFRLGQES